MLKRNLRNLVVVVCRTLLVLAAVAPARGADAKPDVPQTLSLQARSRVEEPPGSWQYRPVTKTLRWDPAKTAVVVCDMWDKHWCTSASARVAEMAPRMNEFLKAARRRGMLVIHCPSGTMDFYKDTPQRKLALAAPKVETRVPLRGWCPLDPKRERDLPIDDSDGGCDTPGCKQGKAWSRQIAALDIAPGDAIGDGPEVYYLMRQRGIENVMLMGVHVNMCVLGRPFGIRQLVGQGMNVALVRDLTDAMYNPAMPPKVSHFRGTELVVEHIERYWCPTITSSELLGGAAFRFSGDKRPHVVFLVNEDEYGAAETLPQFGQLLADCFGYYCTVVQGRGKHDLSGIEALRTADVAVLFVRRRGLPAEQMRVLREYLDAGRPLVALRTACHGFAPRDAVPEGTESWPDFDREVLGCGYHGHGPNGLGTDVTAAVGQAMMDRGGRLHPHPILAGVKPSEWHSPGSLYLVDQLDPKATVLATGRSLDLAAPVAWTRSYKGGRVFFCSLGHRGDFDQPAFRRMLINAVHWAMDRPVPKLAPE